MTYEEALAFWYGRVNFELRSPKPSDLKLDRMHALLDRLGNPQRNLRIVHIAGSKGKGSTSAMLASILQQAGYRTGLFTSPHLVQVEERIQVSGQWISKKELAGVMAQVAQAVTDLEAGKPGLLPVTFFEVATALGFLHFARRRVELAVIEVGLGGRFDSTNVCRPLVSIITSISFDHTQQLGNTLAQIAFEKAGIVKPERPTVSGVRDGEAREVIEQICRQRRSPLQQLDVDFRFIHEPGQVWDNGQRMPRLQVTTKRVWPTMEIGLFGAHQAANAALAVVAVEELRNQGLTIDDSALAAGLACVRWPARLEVLGRQPLVLLDCAHNLASAQALIDTLHTSFPKERRGRRLLIFAGNRDKDLAGMLHLLARHFTHFYLTHFDNNPRCLPPERLLELAPKTVPCTVCPTSDAAWSEAREAAGPNDLICITGSVFVAGELRPILVRDLSFQERNGAFLPLSCAPA